MADNLIFPIGFDLEAAVKKAETEGASALKRLEKVFSRQPLAIQLDTKGFAELGQNIETLKARLKEIKDQWEKMPTAAKFDLDSDGKIKQLTADGKALWDELLRINTALQGVGQGIQQFAAQSSRALQEETRFAEQMRDAEIRRYNETSRAKLKEQADDEKRYQQWLANKEKEVQKEQEVAQRKQNARERAANAARKAQRDEEVAAYKVNATLKAQEDVLGNLTAKLAIYQQRIQGQQVGSDAWNKTALEIRRVTEELQKANQQMTDFQQMSFQGLSDSMTKGKVQALTQMREQLRQVEADFNRLNQTGTAYDANGGLTPAANNILKQRQALVEQINRMLTTAADAQMQREQEINRIIEQRKAKADAIAAKRKAEQAAIQSNIAKMKEERRILNQQESSVAAINAKLQIQQQRLQSAKFGSGAFDKAAKEVERLTKKLEDAKRKIDEVTGRTRQGASSQTSAINGVTEAYKNQDGYVSRLIKRLAVYASFSAVGSLLSNIREITAEFELQRVSLGAIIQDQAKADLLFSQIKSFALQSPVKILDLTKYTKQLAAYKIGYDELFDTMKRLTDVSVGLGVSMDRVILAYGQTRATGYLRASEIRQFTEMGVPIVEELAAKLSAMNGQVVTAAEVMDMVSKRAISFEMVKEVFEDMTSAGGMFYDMQVKQGNTLYGMWAKLGDAASVMYEQMGNTGIVNEAMRMFINGLTNMMRNWERWAALIGTVGVAYLANVGIMKIYRVLLAQHSADNIRLIASTNAKINTLKTEQKTLKKNQILTKGSIKLSLAHAQAQLKAAQATNLFSKALYGLKAAFLSNPLGWLITVGTTIWMLFMKAEDAVSELAGKISEIEEKYAIKQMRDADKFKELAEAAVGSGDGTKAQKKALDELNRTYGDALGLENLRIESLKAMNHQYAEAIDLIKEYNINAKYAEKEGAIKEAYGERKKTTYSKLEDEMATIGLTKESELGHTEAQRIALDIQNTLVEGIQNGVQASTEKFRSEFLRMATQVFIGRGFSYDIANDWTSRVYSRMKGEVEDYVAALNDEYEALVRNNAERSKALKDANPYKPYLDAFEQRMKILTNSVGKSIDEYDDKIQSTLNVAVMATNDITSGLDGAVTLDSEKTNLEGFIQSLDKLIGTVDDPKRRDALSRLRTSLADFVPTDTTIRVWQQQFIKVYDTFKEGNDKIANSANSLPQYLMQNGETLKTYRERLSNEVKRLQETLESLSATMSALTTLGGDTTQLQKQYGDTLALVQFLSIFLKAIPTTSNNSGRKSDTRLQDLQEINQTLEKINKEYDDLQKKEGKTKALEDIKKQFADTIDYINEMGIVKKHGLHFDYPTEFKSLQQYRKEILKVMKSLKNIQGGKKAVLQLQTMISKADSDELQKQIEQRLKELADRVSRTKTAKEFYDKILEQTGDVDLAVRVAVNVYGEQGKDINKQIRQQIKTLVDSTSASFDASVFFADGTLDYKALRAFAEAQKDALGGIESKAYQELIKISDNAEKDFAKTIEDWLKSIEKAKTYGDKLTDVYRKTNTEIAAIQASMARRQIGSELGSDIIAGLQRKQAEEIAKLQYEAFKDSPMYVQLFDDLDNASTSMLNNMKNQLQGLQGQWKNLDPTQLKEMQGRMNEIDKQLAQRNPFKAMVDSLKEYHRLRTQGDSRGNKSRSKADRDVADWSAKRLAAEQELARVMADPKATQAQIAGAKQMVNYTKKEEAEALKVAENWKKVEDTIGLSANELFQMFNWAGDIAQGIADISEAMGADEEDVQYWNDIASALNEVTAGIQDIVKSAMSGNVVGIISSVLTAVPKMFVGFVNLFSAGKIKRANKEIKRQQELLDQLEYSYSRLEKAADRLFGAGYLDNYNQRLDALVAQQTAYMKQAEAERSKGKKKDKEKIKEYENAARDAADEIKNLQNDLAAHFTGTDQASAARDFATAWLEARVAFENTADAIKSKYKDLIKNMIIEGAAAKVIDNVLGPLYDEFARRLAANPDDPYKAIDYFVSAMDASVEQMDKGMEVLWKALEARGYDMKQMLGDTDSGSYSGIAKDIAGATSEEVNAVAAIGNTMMYHTSFLPLIYQQLVARGGAVATATTAVADPVTLQNEAMNHYRAIEANTAATVARLDSVVAQLSRIVTTRGGRHGITAFIN